jgi:amino acid transporter
VLAARRLSIPTLPGLINTIVTTSAWSCGVVLFFTASRNIYANALNGNAPRVLRFTWRGVPTWCCLIVLAVGCLAFMSVSNNTVEVFSWITNMVGGLWILNSLLQNIIYIRFRAGISAQGIDRSAFPFYRRGQLHLAWFAIFAYAIIFLVSGCGPECDSN